MSTPTGNIFLSENSCHSFAMDKEEKFEQRRLCLEKLLIRACGGNKSELARKIGKPASYVTRMLYAPGKKGKKI